MPPGYREIAAELRAAIERGDYRPGDRLPTEHELAARYGVNRGTANRALDLLRRDGLVESARALGTRVAEPPVRLPIGRYGAVVDPARPDAHLGPWETACARQGIAGRVDIVSVNREPAAGRVAELLDVDQGAQLVRRRRHNWLGDSLAGLQDQWTPAAIADGTPIARPEKIVGGAYAALTAAGHRPHSYTDEVTARPATGDERAEMDLGQGATVIEIWHTTRDATGRPVETVRLVLDARRVRLVYDDLPIEG